MVLPRCRSCVFCWLTFASGLPSPCAGALGGGVLRSLLGSFCGSFRALAGFFALRRWPLPPSFFVRGACGCCLCLFLLFFLPLLRPRLSAVFRLLSRFPSALRRCLLLASCRRFRVLWSCRLLRTSLGCSSVALVVLRPCGSLGPARSLGSPVRWWLGLRASLVVPVGLLRGPSLLRLRPRWLLGLRSSLGVLLVLARGRCSLGSSVPSRPLLSVVGLRLLLRVRLLSASDPAFWSSRFSGGPWWGTLLPGVSLLGLAVLFN